ncbi:DUF1150 family protein [Phenylobacterium montanum]|uniref:DUF1150 domain-containing protein n=1 Tax=Phenylobacterium montanum TaxID=2823693 RepID=A0A975FX47_9CAUL|nr:DUF1150 domain-containing protein [Caulobacter sp. S6]QUD87088.1 DUF1150 domain-containing protein [Caulobacter sp. S6]
MTPHFTNEAFAALGAPNLVYVRPIKAGEVIGAAPVLTEDGVRLEPDQILYAVHSANGARIAVLADRDSAIAAAMANEMAPVSVH